MKIGIATLTTGCANYGGALQAYALQEFLRQNGHEAFLLNTDASSSCRCPPKGVDRYVRHPIRMVQFHRMVAAVERFYSNRFRCDPRGFRPLVDFLADPTPCDAYVTGSDQVWADVKSLETRRYFFLDFGNAQTRRISYAASAGSAVLDEELFEKWRKFLRPFREVCVRERGLCDFLRQHEVPAHWTCDPTLLHTRAFWDALADTASETPDGEGAFCGFLRWETTLNRQIVINTLCHSRGVSVVQPFAGGLSAWLRGKSYAFTPEAWLKVIRGSKFVVTNSFHCVVFSVLFRRPFVVLPLRGRHAASNDRILSLCERLGLSERIADGYESLCRKMDAPIDWQDVDHRLATWRNESSERLLGSMTNE